MSVRLARPHARLRIALVAGLFAGVLGAAPVLADTEYGHTGTVGAHSLTDNSTNTGVVCTYKRKTPSSYFWEGKLKHIDVRPPKMKAVSGSQRVAWRFSVQRQVDAVGPWTTTYKSPIQKATTDTAHNAAFSWMGVDVAVPTHNADQHPSYFYRVIVKMLWYHGDGSVQGTAKHGVDWNRTVEPGFGNSNDEYPCRGWYGWMI